MCEAIRIVFVTALLALPATVPAEVLHDPTRPDTRVETSKRASGGPALHLSAILYSPHRRVAIVNGRAVREGGRIGAARVTRIGRQDMDVDIDGRSVTLRLD